MHHTTRRPAHCAPGSITDARDLGERLRVSRERLAASELATSGQAWRLWAACVEATFGYAREADQVYLTTLARNAAGVHRNAAARIMRRFDELEVFGWTAAPRGSHGISELRLPPLMHSPRCMTDEAHALPTVHEGPHAPPTVHDEPSSCTAHGALQGNTHYVESSESHSSIGNANVVTPQIGETSAEAGTPQIGTPEAGPPLEELLKTLTIDELHAGMANYAPTIADLYAAELERRNVAPRRRPAWLDD